MSWGLGGQGQEAGGRTRSHLDFIKVKWVIARHRAVEPSFQEGSPLCVETACATNVRLADPRHPGEDRLATVHVFYGSCN